jgi:hypothetical protein
MRHSWADWYWPAWLVIGFGVPEFVALRTGHPEWTFSDWIWRVTDTLPGSTIWEWTAIHVFLALFLIWLTLHLVFGIWR